MVKRKISWTRTADLQFIGVLEYWFERTHSTRYSKRLLAMVETLLKQIARNPYLFKDVGFKDTRVAPLLHFSLYYRVLNDQIVVTAFWDNRQDFKKLIHFLQTKT